MSGSDERLVLVDASVFITLVEIGAEDLLYGLRGTITVPDAVEREISEEPAAAALDEAIEADHISRQDVSRRAHIEEAIPAVESALRHLGKDEESVIEWIDSPVPQIQSGDVALLAAARLADEVVVVTDDKPLRKTCKALSIPVSGSIGVLIQAVERGSIDGDEARDKLYAMDEVGARLSASLVGRAERLIEQAAE